MPTAEDFARKPLPREGDPVDGRVVDRVIRSERHETVWIIDGEPYEEWELTQWL